jgi:parvulin-like peptidyl-prolyl isomerase
MKTKFYLLALIVLALLAGVMASEFLCRSAAFRDLAGRFAGRGHLVTIVSGKGIYVTDLGGDEQATASGLIVAENLRHVAAKEVLDPAQVERELALLKAQFANDKAFEGALRASGFSISSLNERIATQLRGEQWLEKQIAPATAVAEQERRQFYDTHRDLFMQPLRFRASHVFLAAHAETPPEVIEEKELAIAAFSARLSQGESLAQLAAEVSEDEATKPRGGDLGFFSVLRMAPEFTAEIQKLHAGEISKSFRSHLGFHIVQVTEIKAARLLNFDEARPEISVALANERLAAATAWLAQNLSRPDYSRPDVD